MRFYRLNEVKIILKGNDEKERISRKKEIENAEKNKISWRRAQVIEINAIKVTNTLGILHIQYAVLLNTYCIKSFSFNYFVFCLFCFFVSFILFHWIRLVSSHFRSMHIYICLRVFIRSMIVTVKNYIRKKNEMILRRKKFTNEFYFQVFFLSFFICPTLQNNIRIKFNRFK